MLRTLSLSLTVTLTLTLVLVLVLVLSACAGSSQRATASSGTQGCRIANFAGQCVTP